MSSTSAIKCDRCGARELCADSNYYPMGWGSLRIRRALEFLDTGTVDLCGDCLQVVYEMSKPRAIAQGK